jgi:hypothetical protein
MIEGPSLDVENFQECYYSPVGNLPDGSCYVSNDEECPSVPLSRSSLK